MNQSEELKPERRSSKLKSQIKNPLSLRMQLTLVTALLTAVICVTLSAYISTTAILSMDKIENSVIAVFPKEAFEIGGEENMTTDEELGANDFYLDIQGDISTEIQDTQREFWTKSLLATCFIVIASSLLVYLLVGSALKPLAAFTACVEKISDQNIEDTVEVPHASKEILRLTDVFNAMMKRLGRAFTMQKQFAARAAHELRTPLAVMQTKLDVYQKQDVHSGIEYEEIIDMCATQTARLSHVVNLLLDMTQLQRAERADRIALSPLIEEVLCDLQSVADEKNITLVQNEGDALITGNDTLIYRAVYNLTENAIKYNRDGGFVTLSVTSDNAYAVINVTDTGRGISAENRDKIFEPFFRSQEKFDSQDETVSVGGAGLGLALVKEIAIEHGGDVFVADSSDAGSRITLSIRK